MMASQAAAMVLGAAAQGSKTCGQNLYGDFVMRVHPWQTQPDDVSWNTQWDAVKFTYSTLSVPQNSNTFTQTFVDSEGRTVTCEWTCESEQAPGDSTAWNIVGGKMTQGQDVSKYMECQNNIAGAAPKNPLLPGAGNCGGDGYAFQIVMTQHKLFDPASTSWRWKLEFLLGNGQSRMAYLMCPAPAGTWSGTAFKMEGDAKEAPPTFEDVSAWTQPGTLIIVIIFIIFASGWVYLFYSSCGKLPDLPESDDEGSEGESSEGESSGSGSEETGSDSADEEEEEEEE